MRDYYEVLGVPRDASDGQIKRAYRTLAKKYHPDVNPGNEEAESRFPVINRSREMTTDTGGAGRWRGQPGSRNVKQVLEPFTAVAWMVSMRHPLRGLQGGDDAAPYRNTFLAGTPEAYTIENSAQAQLPAGAVLDYQYGGGGGFGSALLRKAEDVKEDVLDEYVSVEAARDRYGVVFRGSVEDFDLEIDWDATGALRASLAAERGVDLAVVAGGSGERSAPGARASEEGDER